jgi:hypothetical protein
MNFKVPFIAYDQVGQIVKDFLAKFHPSLELPIPIEGIIEFDLGLHIIPIPFYIRISAKMGF